MTVARLEAIRNVHCRLAKDLDLARVVEIAVIISEITKRDRKLLICGSASDSQHLAAQLVGRFHRERGGLPAIALTTDSSVVSAVANDYDSQHVFSRQIHALANPGDVLMAISPSGKTPSVRMAVDQARVAKMTIVGLTGQTGLAFAKECDAALVVPSESTARIQEMHGMVIHMICHLVDEWMGGIS